MPDSDQFFISVSDNNEQKLTPCRALQCIPQTNQSVKKDQQKIKRHQSARRYLQESLFLILMAIGIGGGLTWYHMQDSLLISNIHHHQIICDNHSFTDPSTTNVHLQSKMADHNYSMVQIDLDQALPRSVLDTLNQNKKSFASNQFSPEIMYVLNWANQHPHTMLMLKTKKDPTLLAQTIKKSHIKYRTMIAVTTIEAAKKIFAVDPYMVVSVPIKNLREEKLYRPLTLTYNLAFRLPYFASQELFDQAHRDAIAVITDRNAGNGTFANPGNGNFASNLSADILIAASSIASATN